MHGLQKPLPQRGRMKKRLRCLTAVWNYCLPTDFPYDPYYADLIDAYFCSRRGR